MLSEEEKIVNKEQQRSGLLDYIEYPDAIRFYETDVLEYLKKHKIKAAKNF